MESYSRFPAEIRAMIRIEAIQTRLNTRPRVKLAPLAGVSWEWQADVEKMTFSKIEKRMTVGNFRNLEAFLVGERRSYVTLIEAKSLVGGPGSFTTMLGRCSKLAKVRYAARYAAYLDQLFTIMSKWTLADVKGRPITLLVSSFPTSQAPSCAFSAYRTPAIAVIGRIYMRPYLRSALLLLNQGYPDLIHADLPPSYQGYLVVLEEYFRKKREKVTLL